MPQIVAHKPVCSECGEEALGKALFCFKCGSRLTLELPTDEKGKERDPLTELPIEAPSGEPFEETQDKKRKKKTKKKNEKTEAEEPAQDVAPDQPVESERSASTVQTASSIRKDLGVMRLRRIETRWIPEEGQPNLWFVVGTLLLFGLAFGVFLISMYLR